MSLLPGWDAAHPGLPPKDLQDIDELAEERPKSYFQKLEQSKSLRRTSAEIGGVGSVSLSRPIPSLSSSLSSRSSGMRPAAAASVPHRGAVSPTSSATAAARHGFTSGSMGSKNKYVGTDWEAEIKVLESKGHARSAGLARASLDSSSSITEAQQQQHAGWWARLDSGAMNRGAEPDLAPSAANASKGIKLDFTGSHLH